MRHIFILNVLLTTLLLLNTVSSKSVRLVTKAEAVEAQRPAIKLSETNNQSPANAGAAVILGLPSAEGSRDLGALLAVHTTTTQKPHYEHHDYHHHHHHDHRHRPSKRPAKQPAYIEDCDEDDDEDCYNYYPHPAPWYPPPPPPQRPHVVPTHPPPSHYSPQSPYYGPQSPYYGPQSPYYGPQSPYYGPQPSYYGPQSPYYGSQPYYPASFYPLPYYYPPISYIYNQTGIFPVPILSRSAPNRPPTLLRVLSLNSDELEYLDEHGYD